MHTSHLSRHIAPAISAAILDRCVNPKKPIIYNRDKVFKKGFEFPKINSFPIIRTLLEAQSLPQDTAFILPKDTKNITELRKAIFDFLDSGGSAEAVFKAISNEKAYEINAIALYSIDNQKVLGELHPKILALFDKELKKLEKAVSKLELKDNPKDTPKNIQAGQVDGCLTTKLNAGWIAYGEDDMQVLTKMLIMGTTAIREYHNKIRGTEKIAKPLKRFEGELLGRYPDDFRQHNQDSKWFRRNNREIDDGRFLSFTKDKVPWKYIDEIISAGIGHKFHLTKFNDPLSYYDYRRDIAVRKSRAGDLHKDSGLKSVVGIRFHLQGQEDVPLHYYDVPSEKVVGMNEEETDQHITYEILQRDNIQPAMTVALPPNALVFFIHGSYTPHMVGMNVSTKSRNFLSKDSRINGFELPISKKDLF